MPRPKREVPWLEERDNGVYYVVWYDSAKKQTRRLSLHTRDSAEATARYAAFLQEGGDIIRGEAGLRLKVVDAIDRYLDEHVDKRCADPRRQHDIAAHLRTFFNGVAVADVDIPASRAYAAARDAAPSTVKRELGMLTAAANHARKWGRLPADQMPRVEYPDIPEPDKVRFFTAEQIEELIRHSTGRLRAFITIAYFTAARRRSIENLEISQVNLERRTISLQKPGSKVTKKRRPVVPINDACLRQIRMLIAISTTKYLFDSPTCFYRQFTRLCKRLGYGNDCHPHMLRHSRATHLLQAGQDPYKVAGLLGDTLKTLESVYGHHTPEHSATAVSPWDDMIAAHA